MSRNSQRLERSEAHHMTTLKFNVAQLLREPIGAKRTYTFEEPQLALDGQLHLREISGSVQFTRTASGVYAWIRSQGTVALTCMRSLEIFDEVIAIDVREEMHSVVDIFTGGAVPQLADAEDFRLDGFHMADVGEVIREYTLLELPIKPVSPAYRHQPISYSVGDDDDDPADVADVSDARLAVLRELIHRPSAPEQN